MTEVGVEVRGVAKCYRLGVAGTGWLFRDIQSWWARRLGREDPHAGVSCGGLEMRQHGERIWALCGVDLDVSQGEVLGIIGRNGAGKSTLLKILTRVTLPTRGTVRMRGKVASMLEVGTGFHPELTGRENVFLNGAILGMKRAEIRRKFDEIVEFSGVGRFIDTPVKRYSSGMHVRLAFAVAAHLDADIMLVDEVLAVGDAEFQKRCLGKMGDVARKGRTVLFVSHNMAAIRSLCSRVVVMDGGRVVFDGVAADAVDRHLGSGLEIGAEVDAAQLAKRGVPYMPFGIEYFRALDVALLDGEGAPRSAFRSDEEACVRVTCECLRHVPEFRVIVTLTSGDDVYVAGTDSMDEMVHQGGISLEPGRWTFMAVFPPYLFGTGRLWVNVSLIYMGQHHVAYRRLIPFDVTFVGFDEEYCNTAKLNVFVRPRVGWTREKAVEAK